MLDINSLNVRVSEKLILKNLKLRINSGEVHAIMGPNGSGKSTLAQVLAGRDEYKISSGVIHYNGHDLLDMDPEERACEGLFMSFQYPVAIPGISLAYFLKTALNAIRKQQGLDNVDAADFIHLIKDKMQQIGVDQSFLNRSLNEGFSGGEKKRCEILQMLVLNPKLAILDETDSGLDIDALRTVAMNIKQFQSPDNAVLIITHYQRLLNYITPDYVHILLDGRIVRSGDQTLAHEIEAKGYDWLKTELT